MYEYIAGPPMSGLLVSLRMFPMYEFITGPSMSGLLLSMWIFSYVWTYYRSSYKRFVSTTEDASYV